eukprot:PhF_6_TR43384/c0_g1_i1/m.66571
MNDYLDADPQPQVPSESLAVVSTTIDEDAYPDEESHQKQSDITTLNDEGWYLPDITTSVSNKAHIPSSPSPLLHMLSSTTTHQTRRRRSPLTTAATSYSTSKKDRRKKRLDEEQTSFPNVCRQLDMTTMTLTSTLSSSYSHQQQPCQKQPLGSYSGSGSRLSRVKLAPLQIDENVSNPYRVCIEDALHEKHKRIEYLKEKHNFTAKNKKSPVKQKNVNTSDDDPLLQSSGQKKKAVVLLTLPGGNEEGEKSFDGSPSKTGGVSEFGFCTPRSRLSNQVLRTMYQRTMREALEQSPLIHLQQQQQQSKPSQQPVRRSDSVFDPLAISQRIQAARNATTASNEMNADDDDPETDYNTMSSSMMRRRASSFALAPTASEFITTHLTVRTATEREEQYHHTPTTLSEHFIQITRYNQHKAKERAFHDRQHALLSLPGALPPQKLTNNTYDIIRKAFKTYSPTLQLKLCDMPPNGWVIANVLIDATVFQAILDHNNSNNNNNGGVVTLMDLLSYMFPKMKASEMSRMVGIYSRNEQQRVHRELLVGNRKPPPPEWYTKYEVVT